MTTRSAANTGTAYASEELSVPIRAGALSGSRSEVLRQRLVGGAMMSSDIVVALLVCEIAFVLQGIWGNGQLSGVTVAGAVPTVMVWVALRALMGLYPGYGLDPAEELRRQTYALLATLSTTMLLAVAVQLGYMVSRLALFLSFLGLLILAPLARQATKWMLMKLSLWGKPVVVFGAGDFGGQVAAVLNAEWSLGYKPIAVFGSRPPATPHGEHEEVMPDEESLATAARLARYRGVDTIILAMPQVRRRSLAHLVGWASRSFRHVTIIPDLEGITNSSVMARNFAGIFGVEIRYNLLNPAVLRAKRAIDLAATVAVGVVVLPLILVLSLLVWLESGRPIFYSADRLGRDDKLFSCLKFRTMVPDAETTLRRVLEEDPLLMEEYSKYHKLRKDPRVTRVGRLLRATSLDELPQLWNVLRGEMSLVGPRPYLPRESDDIGNMQSEILRVYPGITGPWQVSGRNDVAFSERVAIDAHYVRNWSIWLDLVLLARTAWVLIAKRAAY